MQAQAGQSRHPTTCRAQHSTGGGAHLLLPLLPLQFLPLADVEVPGVERGGDPETAARAGGVLLHHGGLLSGLLENLLAHSVCGGVQRDGRGTTGGGTEQRWRRCVPGPMVTVRVERGAMMAAAVGRRQAAHGVSGRWRALTTAAMDAEGRERERGEQRGQQVAWKAQARPPPPPAAARRRPPPAPASTRQHPPAPAGTRGRTWRRPDHARTASPRGLRAARRGGRGGRGDGWARTQHAARRRGGAAPP